MHKNIMRAAALAPKARTSDVSTQSQLMFQVLRPVPPLSITSDQWLLVRNKGPLRPDSNLDLYLASLFLI